MGSRADLTVVGAKCFFNARARSGKVGTGFPKKIMLKQ